MKVSIIVSDLSETGAGRWGGAVRPFLLSQALQHLGHQVEILGFCQGINEKLMSRPELPIYQFPIGNYPQFLGSARQLIRQLSGDLIYAYKTRPTSFGLGLWARRQLGGRLERPLFLDIDDWEMSWYGGDGWRYVPSPRGLLRDLTKSEWGLRYPDHPFYVQRLEGWVDKADRITTHNQFLQRRFGGHYIPNGKDVDHFNPQTYDPQAQRRHYGWENYRILMFPGAPRPYKGLEDVLMALDSLDQSDLRLVIVGGSPYDDYDQKLLAQWSRWIIQLPKTPYGQMPGVISAAHMVVVPQRDNPAAQAQFPLKLTDGMAMAKPILATQVGDIPQIVGDTGYLVAPNSPEQLAQQIEAMFGNWDQAQAQGHRGRQRCVEYYSIAAMAGELGKLLGEVNPGE
jgi:glycosyltransferase involved in cell wall biosynthesis